MFFQAWAGNCPRLVHRVFRTFDSIADGGRVSPVDCSNADSVETFLQQTNSRLAVKALTSLSLIDINPPFGHDRACSNLHAATQTHFNAIRFCGMLYLIYKLSQIDC